MPKSTKPRKEVDPDKIIALFKKYDLEDKIILFHEIKNYLTEELVSKASEHEEQQNRLISIRDEINRSQ